MPLSTMSYPTRSLVAPRFVSNLTADMREEEDDEGQDELDSAVTYDGFVSERDSGTLRNGNEQLPIGRKDLYLAGQDTEKTIV